MGKREYLPTLLSVFLLTGCGASLSDLQDMSTSDRADFVCERRPEVKTLYRNVNKSTSTVQRVEKALRLGYWERTKCTTYRYPDKKGNPQSTTSCVPVKGPPINRLRAEAALSRERERLVGHRAVHQRALADCKGRVMNMTPERAFDYHQEGRQ